MRENRIGPRAFVVKAGSHGPAERKQEKAPKERGPLEGPAGRRYAAFADHFEGPLGNPVKGGSRVYTGNSGTGTRAPDPTSDTGKKGTFRTVTANIKSNPEMPQDKVVHDVRKVAAQGDLIGWQEIGPARYFDAIKSLGKGWEHYMPKDGKNPIPVPISWKKSEWDLQDAGYTRTHKGEKKVSPHRYISWVKLKNKETGEEVVRINTHLVSGAWAKDKQGRPTTPWRKDMWNKHMDELGKMVERFEKQGHKVVVGGDFNRDSYKVLGNDVVYDNKLNVGTHGHSTLDYMMHTRDRELEHVRTKYARRLYTDHDAIVATYRLK